MPLVHCPHCDFQLTAKELLLPNCAVCGKPLPKSLRPRDPKPQKTKSGDVERQRYSLHVAHYSVLGPSARCCSAASCGT